MSTGAGIVSYSVDPKRVEEHIVQDGRQKRGYRGFLLDQGDGKRLVPLLFDSVEDVSLAQQTLTPVGRNHTHALMSVPTIGSIGTVVIGDGTFADPPAADKSPSA